MKNADKDWYKKIWSLDIKNQSWVEDTVNQTDFIISALQLKGNERILDLACGFGRHSLELARRGFSVVGVDITKEYVKDALKTAKEEGLSADFFCSDIRDVDFQNEFDAVLNLADGAVGYLENDEENLKIFDIASRALKVGGKHFMDIMNADYADSHFPAKMWDAGEKGLTLSCFEWNKKSRIMMYGQHDVCFGEALERFEFSGCPTRLYTIDELEKIMASRGMKVFSVFSDYYGNPASKNAIQQMVCSVKVKT